MLAADGTRIAECRPWIEAELGKDNGDIRAIWERLRETGLQISEWHGNSVYAFAPTGSGAADYVQVSLGREVEWCAEPIVNPSWIDHDARPDDKVIASGEPEIARSRRSAPPAKPLLWRSQGGTDGRKLDYSQQQAFRRI